MGAVYEVIDRTTNRRRAMKTMLPSIISDADSRARFALEAKVTAPIRSDHIVDVIDAGIDAQTGLPFLVMELLDGEDLGARLERSGPLPFPEVVLLLQQVAWALEKTHDEAIIHRDLKPENLFVTIRDDGTPHVKVLDFGIAKLVAQSTRARTTRNIGTPLYMSPEQIRGDGTIDKRADLYSVGHVAFALLAGEPYWAIEARSAGIYAVLAKVVEGATALASPRAALGGVTLPPGFDLWFARATALDPSKRFESAGEMVTELANALGVPVPRRRSLSEPVSPDHPSAPPRQGRTLPSEPSSRLRPPAAGSTAPLSSTRPKGSASKRRTVPASGVVVFLLVAAGVPLCLAQRGMPGADPSGIQMSAVAGSVEPVALPRPLPPNGSLVLLGPDSVVPSPTTVSAGAPDVGASRTIEPPKRPKPTATARIPPAPGANAPTGGTAPRVMGEKSTEPPDRASVASPAPEADPLSTR